MRWQGLPWWYFGRDGMAVLRQFELGSGEETVRAIDNVEVVMADVVALDW